MENAFGFHAIAEKVIDITLPTVARAADRDVLADPTPVVTIIPVDILAGRNKTRETNMAGYLLTFDLQVWALLLFFLVFLSIVMASLATIAQKMRRERASVLEIWSQHFWMLFENMFCEASAEMPERTELRIVSAVWWIAIVVLMNAFAGQMRACLMVKSELKRINTLTDIAERPYLKVYTLKNTVATRYLQSSQGAAERKVWNMIRRDGTDLYGLLRFPEEMIHEIVQEKAVVVHAKTILQNEASISDPWIESVITSSRLKFVPKPSVTAGKYCAGGEPGEFYFGTEVMYTLIFGSYMKRQMNETLRKRIKRITTALGESGLFSHLYATAIPSLDQCSVVEEGDELRLQDLASVFYLYAAFCFASILAFVAELLVHRYSPPECHAYQQRRKRRSVAPVFVRPHDTLTAKPRAFTPQVEILFFFSCFVTTGKTFADYTAECLRALALTSVFSSEVSLPGNLTSSPALSLRTKPSPTTRRRDYTAGYPTRSGANFRLLLLSRFGCSIKYLPREIPEGSRHFVGAIRSEGWGEGETVRMPSAMNDSTRHDPAPFLLEISSACSAADVG
ncbi:hypothetical protein HPB51_007994 [Rhipicephalus microplus]|uniref:Ionotropic glutamate receptor C-terminal domain-containing protein n=1 Tax=Rhipicephalus microplus TaxID=6941 RepID=A0A9J6DFT9_RHIMP|nr:hypothetical protein HPB51_007994 [Rhipicephalus microplus]